TALTETVSNQVKAAQPDLQKLIHADATLLGQIQQSVSVAATRMDCDHLTSETGRRLSCTVAVLPPVKSIDFTSALRVLFNLESTADYVEVIDVTDFYEAAHVFLKQRSPQDPIVTANLERVEKLLRTLSSQSERRVENVKSRIHEN